MARDPARLPEEIRERVEIFPGSTDDPGVLRRALDGVDALFWCVPAEALRETEVRGHYENFARVGAQAILETGTPRVVTISAVGNGLARDAGPISGLHAMEDILNESGAAIRHLRCGAFMENFLGQMQAIIGRGVFAYPLPGHIAIPMVAAKDIADVALRWLVRRDWHGIAGVAVRGPEDLSYNQAASVLERVLDRPVRYQEASSNRYVQSLMEAGASAEFARGRVEMFTELAHGITRAESGTVEIRTATTLSRWVESEFVSAHRAGHPPLGESLVRACVCLA